MTLNASGLVKEGEWDGGLLFIVLCKVKPNTVYWFQTTNQKSVVDKYQ